MIMSLMNTMFIYLIFYVLDHVDLPDILYPWSCLSTWYSISLIMFIYLLFYDLDHVDLPDILQPWTCLYCISDILWSLPCRSTWYSTTLNMFIYLIFYDLYHVDLPDILCPWSCWRPSSAPHCPSCVRRLAWSSSLSWSPALFWCWRTPPAMEVTERILTKVLRLCRL